MIRAIEGINDHHLPCKRWSMLTADKHDHSILADMEKDRTRSSTSEAFLGKIFLIFARPTLRILP